MTAREYQTSITPLLRSIFEEVTPEWIAFRGLGYQYSPRVDIAVGPYSTIANEDKIAEYNMLLSTEIVHNFLEKVYNYHILNVGENWLHEIHIPSLEDLIHKNENARCLIAFEIENWTTKKHIMGSMVNAASLGRIGIGVAYNEAVERTFVRIMNYLAFLKRVGKNSYDTTNFLIITKTQLETILNEV
jgi:hypothetical protein